MKLSKWTLALAAFGLAGTLTASAVVSPAFGASGTATSGSAVRILSTRQTAPIVLSDSVQAIVQLRVPAGHWLVTGKLYADSVPSTGTATATIGCTLLKGGTQVHFDDSFFNVPKAPGDTAAAVISLEAVIRPTTTTTIVLRCADFGSDIETHDAVLAAIGG
jgi:hypothetical protein